MLGLHSEKHLLLSVFRARSSLNSCKTQGDSETFATVRVLSLNSCQDSETHLLQDSETSATVCVLRTHPEFGS